jgi:hypothetical protein
MKILKSYEIFERVVSLLRHAMGCFPFGYIEDQFYTDISCLGWGICEKYQSRDEKFPEPNII